MGSSSAQIRDKVMRGLLSLWPEWMVANGTKRKGTFRTPSVSDRIERLIRVKERMENITENYVISVPIEKVKMELEKK
jgi:hypothetical protein